MKNPERRRKVTQSGYEALAAFRATLRQFLAFSEAAAEGVGLTPRQYQVLLAIRGVPRHEQVTIGDLADRLRVRPHSAVGLVDRLVSLGLLARQTSKEDRRRVHAVLTPRGRRMLERLASVHLEELKQLGPRLDTLLRSLEPRPHGAGRHRSRAASQPR
jgi:DNA-binding MarR family transcriptional regulator